MRDSLVVASLAQGVAQPLETLVKTVTGGSASRLDVLDGVLAGREKHSPRMTYPGTLSEAVETKLVGDFRSVHCVL